MQIRQLRKDYADEHYVSALLRYVWNFFAKFRNLALLISVDDKAIMPVGKPNRPISTGVCYTIIHLFVVHVIPS